MRKMGMLPAEKPKKKYKQKPFEQMTYPCQRIQADVKVVSRACSTAHRHRRVHAAALGILHKLIRPYTPRPSKNPVIVRRLRLPCVRGAVSEAD